jgi:hypothetical protein
MLGAVQQMPPGRKRQRNFTCRLPTVVILPLSSCQEFSLAPSTKFSILLCERMEALPWGSATSLLEASANSFAFDCWYLTRGKTRNPRAQQGHHACSACTARWVDCRQLDRVLLESLAAGHARKMEVALLACTDANASADRTHNAVHPPSTVRLTPFTY